MGLAFKDRRYTSSPSGRLGGVDMSATFFTLFHPAMSASSLFLEQGYSAAFITRWLRGLVLWNFPGGRGEGKHYLSGNVKLVCVFNCKTFC